METITRKIISDAAVHSESNQDNTSKNQPDFGKIIEASPYFDSKWYLMRNPDVRKAGVDPAEHYLTFGWKECRNPGPEFDSNAYLEANPDVRKAGVCPLLHYELYGRNEKRNIRPPAVQKPMRNNSYLITKIFTGDAFRHLYLRFIFDHFWPNMGWWKVKEYYKNLTGKHLDYSNPRDLNEKLMWLERYWRHPLKTICSDKYLVREYIINHGMEDMLVPLIGVWDDVDDIDFNALPKQFVLKCNHGSGFNIICLDKDKLDIDDAKRKLKSWIKEDFSRKFCEVHYHDIHHKIICEKLISESAPAEYQFWCINGEPQSILACRKNFNGTYESCSYSLDGEQLFDRIGEMPATLPVPRNMDSLVKKAKLLAEPFPFIRADFYEVEGKIYFAEMTFSPSANVLSNYKDDFINKMGEKLRLPKRWPRTDWKEWNTSEQHVQTFVEYMRQYAASIGMKTAHFNDPTGLSYQNYGSVKDLACLLKEVVRVNLFEDKWNVDSYLATYYEHYIKPRKINFQSTIHHEDFNDKRYKLIGAKTGSDGYVYNIAIVIKAENDIYTIGILNAENESERQNLAKKLIDLAMLHHAKSAIDGKSICENQTVAYAVNIISKEFETKTILSHNEESVHPFLSITKILSAILIKKYIKKLPFLIKIGGGDLMRGSGNFFPKDSYISVETALYAAMLPSSNTAIHALARNVGKIIQRENNETK